MVAEGGLFLSLKSLESLGKKIPERVGKENKKLYSEYWNSIISG
jgi:hypothetical protein